MTKLPEQRTPSPKPSAKAIAPHKLMRTWRYKETKHSLKKKAKSVTLNFPLSLCSFTAKDHAIPPSSPSSSPVHFPPSPPHSPSSVTSLSPPLSPISPRIPSPNQFAHSARPAPTNITLPPIPVTSPTHEFYWDQREGLRAIACGVSRPRLDDPLAYFKSLSASDKILLPAPSMPLVTCTSPQATPLTCY
eukprot:Phypoly_transcript_16864.p1 GENE.Phypoly_transcript_16864~~Phypoly_transcript_16864.p1  ORF type:complete len:190 (+),score=36.26 Phypoly_transcript_16864:201-770(+)